MTASAPSQAQSVWLLSLLNGYEALSINDPLRTRPPELKDTPTGLMPNPCPTFAQWDEPLTLATAMDMAVCAHPQARLAWINILAESVNLGQARADFLPTLSGNRSRLTTTTTYPDENRPAQTQRG